MSLTAKQQEAINEAIAEHLKAHDKVSQQYLQVRAQILALSSGTDENKTEVRFKVQKLRYELDTAWETYREHLRSVALELQSVKSVASPFVGKLTEEYEALAAHKVALKENIKNMKEVQIPLLQQMKSMQESFDKQLNNKTAPRGGFTRNEFANGLGPGKVDIRLLAFSKEEIEGLFQDFSERLNSLRHNEDAGAAINVSEYIEQDLDSNKFMKIVNQQVLQVSSVASQERTLEQYDEAIDKLTGEIIEMISQSQAAKDRWIKNANMLDAVAALVNEEMVLDA